jgi:hypothetical protein
MTILFDKLAYIDSLKRAGLSEEHARTYAEALEQATAGKTDQDAWVRIESKIDEQERRRKAFWKAANNFGPMLFLGAALGVMLVVLLK